MPTRSLYADEIGDYANRLLVCSVHDVVERIDILLVEARHLQVNTAWQLCCGRLLEPLRWEENFLWGRAPDDADPKIVGSGWCWETMFDSPDFTPALLPRVARFFVPDLPIRDREGDPGAGELWRILRLPAEACDGYGAMQERIREELKRRLAEDQWAQDERRQVFQFQALQALKRRLLEHKLELLWWHHQLGLRPHGGSGGPRDRLALLAVLRAVVLHEVEDCVAILGDVRAQIAHALDIGQHLHQRPVATRRRLQGLYTAFLSETGLSYRNQIDRLLEDLELERREAGMGHRRPGKKPAGDRSVFGHRWEHHVSSAFRVLADAPSGDVTVPPEILVGFVNSSYWMPDRPDLEVELAHEVAHLGLIPRLGLVPGRGKGDFALLEGPFARLIREIDHVLDSFEVRREPWSRAPVRGAIATLEIVTDMLAAAVTGPAYLYALFLELLGRDCQRLFQLPNGAVSLAHAARYRDGSLTFTEPVDGEWYVRLWTLTAWLDEILPGEGRSPLFAGLLEGVRDVANAVLSWLESRASGEAHRYPALWRAVAGRIEEIVRRHPAVLPVRRYRALLLADRREFGKAGERRIRTTDRLARPLPEDLSDWLLDVLIGRKRRPGRLLHGEVPPERPAAREELRTWFARTYLGETGEWHAASPGCGLFVFLQDIPWECALLRAHDHVDVKRGGRRSGSRLAELSLDFAPGRELYHFAMEMQLWLSRRPYHRLMTAIRAIEDIREGKRTGLEEEPVGTHLRSWLDGGTIDSREKIEAVLEKLRSVADGEAFREAARDAAESCGARALAEIGSVFPGLYDMPTSGRQWRHVVDSVHGEKLQQLQEIMENISCKNQSVGSILRYLNAHRGSMREQSRRRICTAFGGWHVRGEMSGEPQADLAWRELTSVLVRAEAGEEGNPVSRLLAGCAEPKAGGLRFGSRPDGGLGQRFVRQAALGHVDLFEASEGAFDLRPSVLVVPDGDSDLFVPYIERREIGLRFSLARRPRSGSGADAPGEAQTVPFSEAGHGHFRTRAIAALNILLRQRNERLEFLLRLLETIDEEASEPPPSEEDRQKPENLAEAVKLFQTEDFGYLTEGTADIALVFRNSDRKAVTEERLREILGVGIAFFDDYMVDRTELVFFVPALEAFAGEGCGLELRRHVRLRESRGDNVAREYEKFLLGKLRGIVGTGRPPNVRAAEVPGRTDFVVTFPAATIRSLLREGGSPSAREIFELLDGLTWNPDLVEKMETVIEFPIDPKSGTFAEPTGSGQPGEG